MQNILFFNPDIKELAENLTIGPQADILELIEDFNNKYIGDSDYYQAPAKKLGITKKFYWKPGAYDTIKAVINRLQCFNMKANGLWKVVDRVRHDGAWRMRELSTKLSSIETQLYGFRNEGMVMQDNTDDAIEAWNLLKNHLIEQYNNSGNFTIYVEESVNTIGCTDYLINIVYKYQDFNISYKHFESPKELASIFCPGTAEIRVKLYLSKFINCILKAKMDISKIARSDIFDKNRNRRGSYTIGGHYQNKFNLEHPYIARQNGYNNQGPIFNDEFKYICMGSLTEEIRSCVATLDFISLQVFIDRLMLHYDTRTGPMNSINYSYHGQPNFLVGNNEYYDIISRFSSDHCNYRSAIEDMEPEWIENDSYCGKYCSIKSTCTAYTRNTRSMTSEEKERLAIEQATLNAARRV
tara:strand:+ start:236 stop:1468 length:1233 start_codon:yes stop_codon:yes gene_type:complete